MWTAAVYLAVILGWKIVLSELNTVDKDTSPYF